MYNFAQIVSVWFLPILILIILTVGIIKKVPIYEVFIEGAKDGVKTGLNIIPYLVAIIAAVSMFRASGFLEAISSKFHNLLLFLHVPSDILPIIFTRSLSGSATLGVLADIINTSGIDPSVVILASVMVGSSETTFYVLSVYFGSVGIKKYRHSITAGILADIVGIVLAIIVCEFVMKIY